MKLKRRSFERKGPERKGNVEREEKKTEVERKGNVKGEEKRRER